jgi:hypothetical protein
MAGLTYIPPRRNPMMGFLQNLALMRIGHNMKMEETDRRIAAASAAAAAQQQEQRQFEQGQAKKKEGAKMAVAGHKPQPSPGPAGVGGVGVADPSREGFFYNPVTQQVHKRKADFAKTAWQAFLRKPRTDEEIVDFAQKLKTSPTTNVNVNLDMTKKTQADLEGEVVQGKGTLDMLKRVKGLYKREFHEYLGKGKVLARDIGSKLGVPAGKFHAAYRKYALEVDKQTFLFRKFITGVAGGEKEMTAIEKLTLNTKYDSPDTAEAKMAQMEIMTNAQIKRAQDLLSAGIDVRKLNPQQRAQMAEKFPIENYGYKDIDMPGDREKPSEYAPGAIYEDAEGKQMRFDGYDRQGKPIWSAP